MKQIIMVLLLSITLGCSTPGTEPGGAESGAGYGRSDCIFGGTIRDYRVLDESNLVVTAGASRHYHIELVRPAFGLKSSWQIAFVPAGSSVCRGSSELLVDDTMGPERIRLRHIQRLTTDEYDDLLIRYGKKEPEIEQAREPEEVKGAEVEELD